MTELHEYLRRRIREQIIVALTCPRCDVPSFIDDPDGSNNKWCFLCGCTEALSVEPGSE